MKTERRASKLEGSEPARELGPDESILRPSGFRQKTAHPLAAAHDASPRPSQLPRARTGWTVIEEFVRDGYYYRVLRRAVEQRQTSPQLTQREEQVLALAVDGASNKSIAHALGLSPSTVGVLLFRATSKLGAKSRAELLSAYERQKALENSQKPPESE